MAFCTRVLLIQLDAGPVRFDGLFQVADPMVSVSQIVERWVVHRIESYGLHVILDGLLILILIAVRVAQVVVSLDLFGIEIESLLVVDNGIIDSVD